MTLPPVSRSRPPSGKRWLFLPVILVLLLVVYAVTHHKPAGEGQPGKGGKRPVSVVLAPVGVQTVPLEVHTIGNVESVSSVSIKPQIDGQVTGVFFREGDLVQKGQLLFTIDTQPIQAAISQAQAIVSKDQAQVAQARSQLVKDEAQVRQAQATLKRDQSQLTYAAAQEKRFANLLSQQFVSQGEYEQALAARQAAEETVSADRAAVQNAQALVTADYSAIRSAQATVSADEAVVQSNRIRLAYCYMRAPLSGRTGSLRIHRGDTVRVNETEMIVIAQLNPIYVGFSIPEQSLASLKAAAGARPFTVSVKTKENPPATVFGRVNFLDNSVDPSTGTIRLKASFDNQNRLWPGQYVDVSLFLAEQPNALVVPSQAVQSGQKGDYVFTVANPAAPNPKAQMRPVVVDRIQNDLAVIASGLQPGEQVVVDGQFQLSPSAPVRLPGQRRAGMKSAASDANPAGKPGP